MRARRTKDGLTLRAIAGSHVVLLGMNMAREDCDGHLGFAIHRTDHAGEEATWLRGSKTFEATDPGFPPGSTRRAAGCRSGARTPATPQRRG